MKAKLFIPEKIHVGFQNRSNTYSGKLAYIIYTDQKGVKRKETSWQSWRDTKIDPEDFVNEPTEGFVLNKGVGGTRESYGWNPRNEYIRVYDPRGFEFEISVANLLFILQETNSIKGKGIEGEFVYCWDGTELVLLPTNSVEYKSSIEFTDAKTKKVVKADIHEGWTYLTKDLQQVIYIGRLDSRNIRSYWCNELPVTSNNLKKMHIFYNVTSDVFEAKKGFTHLAEINDDSCSDKYADLYTKYVNSEDHVKYSHTEFVEKPDAIHGYIEVNGVVYGRANTSAYYYQPIVIGKHSEGHTSKLYYDTSTEINKVLESVKSQFGVDDFTKVVEHAVMENGLKIILN